MFERIGRDDDVGAEWSRGAHIAQIPVPVPTSRTLWGWLEMGARKSWFSSSSVNMCCLETIG